VSYWIKSTQFNICSLYPLLKVAASYTESVKLADAFSKG